MRDYRNETKLLNKVCPYMVVFLSFELFVVQPFLDGRTCTEVV